MTNPFTPSFGKRPLTYISRLEQTNEVIESFTAEPANSIMYMITDVRLHRWSKMFLHIHYLLHYCEVHDVLLL